MTSTAVIHKAKMTTLEPARLLSALPDVGNTYYLLLHLDKARQRLQRETELWEERWLAAQQQLAEVESQIESLRHRLGYPAKTERPHGLTMIRGSRPSLG